MHGHRILGILIASFLAWGSAAAQDPSPDPPARTTTSVLPTEIAPYVAPPTPAAAPGSFDDVISRTVEREHELLTRMSTLRPMVETYVQRMKADVEGNTTPVQDEYFLRRLDLSNLPGGIAFLVEDDPGQRRQREAKLIAAFAQPLQPAGIARMLVLDTDLYKKYYTFTYVRREFLGEVRCILIDVQPHADAPAGRFAGRIWVEDEGYNIVRFNGSYSGHAANSPFVHFDSWRLNLQPGVWLPAYVYTEESDSENGFGRVHMKAQTRLWGYDLTVGGKGRNQEFTEIAVNDAQVRDQSGASNDAVPVVAERMWERQSEDNALERLQDIGLLAPAGNVDTVLQTVINNLILSNNLTLAADVRSRILITAPLESFTVGHTIVISRGLLDVLPDETALAMVLAHELSHIVLGHHCNTELAFNDRILFPDERIFQQLDFTRSAADEEAADAKAVELLKNSPYKETLASAALFLRALNLHAPDLPNLIHPHLGNSFAAGQTPHEAPRMETLLATGPRLDEQRMDQIAALPLGGRIKLDPWSDRVEMVKVRPLTLVLPREKMPFEITPFFPYLSRVGREGDKVAAVSSGTK